MPPVQITAAVTSDYVTANTSITFETPATRSGDQLIALLAFTSITINIDAINDSLDLAAVGWESTVTRTATSTLIVLRRTATIDEPVEHVIDLDATGPQGHAIMLALRGVDVGADILGAPAMTNITTSAAYVCPSQTAAKYSDLYVGIAYAAIGATAFAPPAGTTEQIEAANAHRILEVFTRLPEAPGATGTKTAVASVAATGFAASLALAAEPTIGLGVSFAEAPAGAIGLPTQGV